MVLRFSILCLSHEKEIIKMSALKILKLVLETQGCSLDYCMVFILKGMLFTFPVKDEDSSSIRRESGGFDLSLL